MNEASISIFIPAYNEEENIRHAVESCLDVLQDVATDYEVIIVDDASTDKTADIADGLTKEYKQVRVIHHKQNTKLGGALRTGFAACKKDIVFYTDADSPIDMSDLKRVLPLLDQYDFITGYRLNREEPLKRKIYSAVYNSIIRIIFGLNVKDVNFSFKLMKRKILENVVLESQGSFIDAELLIEAKRHGYRIHEVGVQYFPRKYGESTLARPGIIVTILKEMSGYYFSRFRKPVPSKPESTHTG